jgi:lipopolysaccharide/colanic/teichoic acid biosynthesis glycosyltransferase
MIAIVSLFFQGGPVFFSQCRVGKNFKRFDIYKFRTMITLDQDKSVSFDAGNKSRITPLGKLLRKSKLDELPQIFNVIKGEMSFVGPRPEVPEWVDLFRSEWEEILTINPGITDPASIEFRNEEELLAGADNPDEYYRQVVLPKKLDLYKGYVENKSLLYDISILLKTLKKVVFSG